MKSIGRPWGENLRWGLKYPYLMQQQKDDLVNFLGVMVIIVILVYNIMVKEVIAKMKKI